MSTPFASGGRILSGSSSSSLNSSAATRIVKPWPRDAPMPRYHLTYLEIDGWEYWSMGAPVRDTTVINRALLTHPGSGDA